MLSGYFTLLRFINNWKYWLIFYNIFKTTAQLWAHGPWVYFSEKNLFCKHSKHYYPCFLCWDTSFHYPQLKWRFCTFIKWLKSRTHIYAHKNDIMLLISMLFQVWLFGRGQLIGRLFHTLQFHLLPRSLFVELKPRGHFPVQFAIAIGVIFVQLMFAQSYFLNVVHVFEGEWGGI